MKISLLILGAVVCAGLTQSCSTHHFSEPNPIHTRMIQTISKKLEPFQLEINSSEGVHRRELPYGVLNLLL